MSKMVDTKSDNTKTAFKKFVLAAEADLSDDEYWCVSGGGDIFVATASKDLTRPVIIFCEACGLDWDEAREQGFGLVRAIIDRALINAALSEVTG